MVSGFETSVFHLDVSIDKIPPASNVGGADIIRQFCDESILLLPAHRMKFH